MAVLLDGKALSRRLNRELARKLRALPRPPGLAVVMVGADPASAVYVRRKARVAERLGFVHQQHDLPADAPEQQVAELLDRLSAEPAVDGILLQLPLPPGLSAGRLILHVAPEKDVDGLHPENVGLLALGRPRFVPCTPAGVLALLRDAGIELEGRRAVVVGRSAVVGRPVSLLLDRANATVTVCHSRTRDLESEVRRAELLVAALGRPRAIPGDWLADGAVVVDVGIHPLPGGDFCGDVDLRGHEGRLAAYTPVPGGVGPMTIAMLMQNTARAAAARQSLDWDALAG